MKVNPVSFLKNKKGLAGLTCIALLVTAAIFIQGLSGRIRMITVLGEGVQTCYQRTHQTYTARVLGDLGAPYLEQSFLSSTQECLADSMSYFEAHLAPFLTGGVTLLNEINDLTHEFNKKLNGMEGNPEGVVASVLGRRFERLETKKDEFLERLENLSGKALASYSSLNWSFFLLIGLVSFFFIGELWNALSLGRLNADLEKKALSFLHDPKAKAEQIGELLTEALETNGLKSCSLLVNGTVRQVKELSSSILQEELPTLKVRPVLAAGPLELDAQIDKMWNAPESAIKKEEREQDLSVSFNEVLGNTLEILSSRFVTSAISLDINIPNNIRVNGSDEEIQQVVYLLLNQVIKSCEGSDKESSLSIDVKTLGNTVFFTLLDSGIGFSKEFLEFNRGLSPNCPDTSRDLLIVREFAKELNADLSFENLLASDGGVVGSKVQVALRSPGESLESGRRLVSLKKGKKKDLEASFS